MGPREGLRTSWNALVNVRDVASGPVDRSPDLWYKTYSKCEPEMVKLYIAPQLPSKTWAKFLLKTIVLDVTRML